jgi:hypothetical protein
MMGDDDDDDDGNDDAVACSALSVALVLGCSFKIPDWEEQGSS